MIPRIRLIQRAVRPVHPAIRGLHINVCSRQAKSPDQSRGDFGKSKDGDACVSDGKGTVVDFSKIPKSNTSKLTPSQKRKQAAELTRTSISDIFDFVMHNSPEELNFKESVNVDAVISQPSSFKKLSFNQKETVVETVDHWRYKEWNEVPQNVKQLMYFVSYGNWGPRESFKNPIANSNGHSNYVPEDIPFSYPSHLKTVNPQPSTNVRKLPAINLMLVNETRKEIFNKNVKKLDPASQAVVIFAFLVTAVAIARDKYMNEQEDDCSLENTIDNVGEETETVEWIKDFEQYKHKGPETAEAEKIGFEGGVAADQSPANVTGKKWYYLWLK